MGSQKNRLHSKNFIYDLARVSVVLEDEELAIDVRKDLQQYMDLMDKKFDLSRMKWREESEQMKKEKGEIDKKIYFL